MKEENLMLLRKEVENLINEIESDLSEYKVRYYKEMPVTSRKKIYNSLKKANLYFQHLMFLEYVNKELFSNEFEEENQKDILEKMINCLNSAVDELLKFFDVEYKDEIKATISEFIEKLNKFSKYSTDFVYAVQQLDSIKRRLTPSNYINLCLEENPKISVLFDCIDDLNDYIYEVKISSAKSYQLYGIKSSLEKFKKCLSIIPIINRKDIRNLLIEYIDDSICFDHLKK